jgi:OmpR family response regulator RpaB
MPHILLIDDDRKLAALLTEYFLQFGLVLATALSAMKGLDYLQSKPTDLVILDVMLPDIDGFETCRRIRQESEIPIIMLTARGELSDKVVGLELGADDYLAKPFEPRELVARIQAQLRRKGMIQVEQDQLRFGDLVIDPVRREAHIGTRNLMLTTMEFQLLQFLALSPGVPRSRDEILNRLKGVETNLYTRSVDLLISRLRHKLGDQGRTPIYIKTLRGTGYVFIGEVS